MGVCVYVCAYVCMCEFAWVSFPAFDCPIGARDAAAFELHSIRIFVAQDVCLMFWWSYPWNSRWNHLVWGWRQSLGDPFAVEHLSHLGLGEPSTSLRTRSIIRSVLPVLALDRRSSHTGSGAWGLAAVLRKAWLAKWIAAVMTRARICGHYTCCPVLTPP